MLRPASITTEAHPALLSVGFSGAKSCDFRARMGRGPAEEEITSSAAVPVRAQPYHYAVRDTEHKGLCLRDGRLVATNLRGRRVPGAFPEHGPAARPGVGPGAAGRPGLHHVLLPAAPVMGGGPPRRNKDAARSDCPCVVMGFALEGGP